MPCTRWTCVTRRVSVLLEGVVTWGLYKRGLYERDLYKRGMYERVLYLMDSIRRVGPRPFYEGFLDQVGLYEGAYMCNAFYQGTCTSYVRRA